jgi:hypothetical protein
MIYFLFFYFYNKIHHDMYSKYIDDVTHSRQTVRFLVCFILDVTKPQVVCEMSVVMNDFTDDIG